MATRFTLKDRQQIEEYTKKGVKISDIAVLLKCTPATVYKEIRIGLTPEQYRRKEYAQYSAIKAQLVGSGLPAEEYKKQEKKINEIRGQISI